MLPLILGLAALGAGVGAATNKKDRGKGAIKGALLGAGAGLGAGALGIGAAGAGGAAPIAGQVAAVNGGASSALASGATTMSNAGLASAIGSGSGAGTLTTTGATFAPAAAKAGLMSKMAANPMVQQMGAGMATKMLFPEDQQAAPIADRGYSPYEGSAAPMTQFNPYAGQQRRDQYGYSF